MPEIHAPYCARHSEDICNATDLTAGKWEIALSYCDGEATVYAFHPEKMLVPEQGVLTPIEAIRLGQALIIQGLRALRGRSRKAQSDRSSACADAFCIRGAS